LRGRGRLENRGQIVPWLQTLILAQARRTMPLALLGVVLVDLEGAYQRVCADSWLS
jgi:hypothetical protein